MMQLKTSKRPIVLTVDGKMQAVVQDARAYERLLDIEPPRRRSRRAFVKVWMMLARAAMRRPAKLLKNSAAGMAYHVRISERALRDLEYIYASIQASSSEQSAVWLANNRCFQPRNLSGAWIGHNGKQSPPADPAWREASHLPDHLQRR